MTKPNEVNIEQLKELLTSDTTVDVICKTLRITRARLRTIVHAYNLPRKKYPKVVRKRDTNLYAEPTPEEVLEIETRKQEVRARWSEKEIAVRFTGPKQQAWTIPSYDFDGRSISFTENNS